uniref:Uncharacterized protein n=1 Tax=Arundo donax TaxID=35708 RepID=A0A0A8Z2V2_ARUDO
MAIQSCEVFALENR